MSFYAAEAASCAHHWGTFLIYNFAVAAHIHSRYHCQQPAKNKLTFFFFLPLPPFSVQHVGQLSWNDVQVYWRWCELSVKNQRDGGIDGEDDEEILMHIYQLINGAVTTTLYSLLLVLLYMAPLPSGSFYVLFLTPRCSPQFYSTKGCCFIYRIIFYFLVPVRAKQTCHGSPEEHDTLICTPGLLPSL